MADSKYANLAGLAPDNEPDVYETQDDRAEEDQTAPSADQPVEQCWQLAAEGQAESTAETINRLSCELNELSSLIGEAAQGRAATSSQSLAALADSLKRQLLVGHLHSLAPNSTDNSCGDVSADVAAVASSSTTAAVTYSLHVPVSGTRQHLSEGGGVTQVLADVEARLQRLACTVGAAPAIASRLCDTLGGDKHDALLPSVAQLNTRLALLEPATARHSEPLLRQVHQLMNRLQQLTQQLRQQRHTSLQQQQQVEYLATLIETTEGAEYQAEVIADRLTELKQLQQQAVDFAPLLSQLEQSQSKLDEQLNSSERQLEQLKTSCKQQLSDTAHRLIQLNETVSKAGL